MEIDRYIRAMERRHRLVIAAVALGALVAALLWVANRPAYEATTEVFVTTGEIPNEFEEAYEAERYTEERMRSYVRIIDGPLGAETIRSELGLEDSLASIEERIHVSVPPHSVLAQISVSDGDAAKAQAMANALGGSAQRLIERLERPAYETPLQASVTKQAKLPSTPVAPLALYVALGGLLGLIAGIGGAMLREALDLRILAEEDARKAAGAPVLGRIPERRSGEFSPVMLRSQSSAGAEAYRSLRTKLLAVEEGRARRPIAVTSSVEEEGKTEVAANLGLALAQAGAGVAMVDADLHHPTLASLLDLRSDFGLADVLADRLSIELALSRHRSLPLAVLGSGRPHDGTSELLPGERFGAVLKELADRFDWVIVDSPALLPATDALAVARQTGAALLVARARSTDAGRIKQATRALKLLEADLLGVVLNRVPTGLIPTQRYGEYGVVPRSRPMPPAPTNGRGRAEWSRW